MKRRYAHALPAGENAEALSRELWRKLKEGDVHAFEAIYQNYVQIVYNYARGISDDENLIEDCIQDLFANIWRNRQNLGEVISLRYYFYASIKRKIIRERKKRTRYIEEALYFQKDSPDKEFSHENELILAEENHALMKNLMEGLRDLNSVQREAIMLKYFEDLSYQEIADRMSLNVGNVYKIISRGLKALERNVHKTSLFLLLLFFV